MGRRGSDHKLDTPFARWLSAEIRRRYDEHGRQWAQQDLADRLGLDAKAVTRWLRLGGLPAAPNIRPLADALSKGLDLHGVPIPCSVDDVLNGIEGKAEPNARPLATADVDPAEQLRRDALVPAQDPPKAVPSKKRARNA